MNNLDSAQEHPSRPHITDPSVIQEMIAKHKHWYHQIELAPGIITPGINQSEDNLHHLEALGFPKSFAGMRVLDVGCADGFMSFEAEKRGAKEVVAIDYRQPTTTGFAIASEILGSSVQHVVENVYDITPERYGKFDVILFLGILYHLRHPLLALDRMRAVSKPGTLLFVETHLIDNYVLKPDGSVTELKQISPQLSALPLWQFYVHDSLNHDATNKWAPNMTALRQIVEEAEYIVTGNHIHYSRGYVAAKAYENPTTQGFRRIDSGKGL